MKRLLSKEKAPNLERFFPRWPSSPPLVMYGDSIVGIEQSKRAFGVEQPKDGTWVSPRQLASLGIVAPKTKALWLVSPEGACRAKLGRPRIFADVCVSGETVGAQLTGCPKRKDWAPVVLSDGEGLRWVPRPKPIETSPKAGLFRSYANSVSAILAKEPLKSLVMKASQDKRTKAKSIKAWVAPIRAPSGGDFLVEVALNKYYAPKKKTDYDPCDPVVPREFVVRQWGLNRGGVFEVVSSVGYARNDMPAAAAEGVIGVLVRGKQIVYVIVANRDDTGTFEVYEIVGGTIRKIPRKRREYDGGSRDIPDTPYDQGPRCQQG
ncbi:MAG: hypothetical protein JRH20_04385 [Deltaproteobacteria bacterium]|nr:hypothetical protein [Deltaproteobacteria bacterium]